MQPAVAGQVLAMNRKRMLTREEMISLATGGGAAVLVILLCAVCFHLFSGSAAPVSREVESYTPLIREYAEEYGIPEYEDLIKAVMMQESNGLGLDPMQAAEGAFNTEYPQVPDGIQDPEYSIRCGVQELKAALESAGVKGPRDLTRICLALQGYNYGIDYIPWAVRRDGGYTPENAEVYAAEQAERLGWPSYGDRHYVPHVLRYYPHGSK